MESLRPQIINKKVFDELEKSLFKTGESPKQIVFLNQLLFWAEGRIETLCENEEERDEWWLLAWLDQPYKHNYTYHFWYFYNSISFTFSIILTDLSISFWSSSCWTSYWHFGHYLYFHIIMFCSQLLRDYRRVFISWSLELKSLNSYFLSFSSC